MTTPTHEQEITHHGGKGWVKTEYVLVYPDGREESVTTKWRRDKDLEGIMTTIPAWSGPLGYCGQGFRK